MDKSSLLELLAQVQRGAVTPESASEHFSGLPFAEAGYEDIGHARIDHHRALRTGLPEVIYAAGKTPQQTAEIFSRMAAAGHAVLATRCSPEAAAAIQRLIPDAVHNELARTVTLQAAPRPESAARSSDPCSLLPDPCPSGPCIAVLCAGTSDLSVAEEAAVTAELFGSRVLRLYDVGVAGLHRLLSVRDQLGDADAVIVCAGMEGALPSVVGGLVGVPVIAVPTSVGYGASFAGAAALLGMLNSCSPNVVVVNIDNGFGAAYTATLIARSAHPAAR
jgi:pyridinium-3,5-biscarboxylic acid mononucleotide synthase